VYENVDNPSRMVTIHVALTRLENPLIGAFTFSKKDKQRIHRASKLRNQVTHSDFELTGEYAASNFFELFGFVSDFQRRHLSSDLSDIIPAANFDRLVGIRRAIEELVRRARERIEEEKIDPEFIWACPNCGEDTFVIEDGADTCYACSCNERVIECPHCNDLCFEFELESFFDQIDTDYDEGRTVIHNSYGFFNFNACPTCLPRIKEAIQDERERDEMYRLEEEFHVRNT